MTKTKASNPLGATRMRVLALLGAGLTVRDMCRILGVSSTNGVHTHLRLLERDGLARNAGGRGGWERTRRGAAVVTALSGGRHA